MTLPYSSRRTFLPCVTTNASSRRGTVSHLPTCSTGPKRRLPAVSSACFQATYAPILQAPMHAPGARCSHAQKEGHSIWLSLLDRNNASIRSWAPWQCLPVQAAERRLRLPRRIVHSLECGFVSGIDEVLAITFTSKAAGRDQVACEGRAQGLWAD